MLEKGQSILYGIRGETVYTLTPENENDLIVKELAQYIRFAQPFVEPGDLLMIPFPRKRTALIKDVFGVRKTKNSVVCAIDPSNPFYCTIEYVGIDLKKVLEDGPAST